MELSYAVYLNVSLLMAGIWNKMTFKGAFQAKLFYVL